MNFLDRLAVHYLLRHRRAAIDAVMLQEARAIRDRWRQLAGNIRRDERRIRELDVMRKEMERMAARAGEWKP